MQRTAPGSAGFEKAEAKGRLDTLYERRLLDYMRRGNTVVDQTEQAKQDFERQYRRCVRKVNGIIAVVGLIVAMVLVFGLRALLFRGTRLVEYTRPIGALEISVSTAKCVLFGLISALGVYSAGQGAAGHALDEVLLSQGRKKPSLLCPGRMRAPAPANR